MPDIVIIIMFNTVYKHIGGAKLSVCVNSLMYTPRGAVLTIGHSVLVTNVQFSMSYRVEISE